MSWAVLLHHVPPEPGYLRAKVARRLAQLGALPLKRAAYYLPANDATIEDLQWLRREIVDAGGEAWVLRSEFLSGITDHDAREAFRAARAADYSALAADARTLLESVRVNAADAPTAAPELARLEKRLAGIRAIDFFDAAGRQEVEVVMQSIEDVLKPQPGARQQAIERFRARRWMTRPGVRVDRMASAWLIRRFIDPAATFVFAPAGADLGDAVRFDMYEGDFTHEGDLCTFEVLLRRFSLSRERALRAIAEMVHDLDVKDDRYQRPETPGLAAMLEGIIARHPEDLQRITESLVVFDSLYQHFKGKARR